MKNDTHKGLRLHGVLRPTSKMMRQANNAELAEFSAHAETIWSDLAIRESKRRARRNARKEAKNG